MPSRRSWLGAGLESTGFSGRVVLPVSEMLDKPPSIRNPVLRERGARALQDRFRPLVAPP